MANKDVERFLQNILPQKSPMELPKNGRWQTKSIINPTQIVGQQQQQQQRWYSQT
jgi:protoheme ferro-lyase